MGDWILALNAGSSSLKFSAFSAAGPRRLAGGSVDHFGQEAARLTWQAGAEKTTSELDGRDRGAVLQRVLADLGAAVPGTPAAIGHRVVHGGPDYFAPERITADVLAALDRLRAFDPEHLPAEIGLMRTLQELRPRTPQYAVFDTAFHRDLPTVARTLPLPRRYQEKGLRRYGFHGLSYTYLLAELRRLDPDRARGRVILAHLGSGASLAAVQDGRCVDTSMAFTPAAGLVMGTRSGDLDPGLAAYFAATEGMSAADFNRLVTHESGLRGISGTSADTRELARAAATDPRAAEALDLFCYQAKKFLGAYAAALGGLDALVFSGGIGENAGALRARICDGLQFLGLALAEPANTLNASVISAASSRVVVRIIPTDEELVIAQAVSALVRP